MTLPVLCTQETNKCVNLVGIPTCSIRSTINSTLIMMSVSQCDFDSWCTVRTPFAPRLALAFSLGSRAVGPRTAPWAPSSHGPRHGPSWAGPRVAASAVAVSRGRSRGRSYKRAAARGGSTWRWLPPGRFVGSDTRWNPPRSPRGVRAAWFARAPVVWSLRLNLRCPTYQAARATRRTPSRYRLGSVPTARRRRWPARGAPPRAPARARDPPRLRHARLSGDPLEPGTRLFGRLATVLELVSHSGVSVYHWFRAMACYAPPVTRLALSTLVVCLPPCVPEETGVRSLLVDGGWRLVSYENPRDARNAALSTPLLSLALVLLPLELRGLGPLSDLLRVEPARALARGLGERGVAPDGDPRGWPRGPWKTGAA